MNRTEISARLSDVFSDRAAVFMADARTGRTWTYGEFESAALRCAGAISRRMPGGKRARVATVCGNSPELLVLFWAVLMLNGEVIPVDVLKGRDEIRRMLTASDPELVVYDNPDDFGFPSAPLVDLMTDKGEAAAFPGYAALDYDRNYLIVFTSGSTGVAKGVVHSFADLYFSATAFAAQFGFSRENTFYHNFPMAFMAGVLNTFVMPLVSGSRIAVGERQSVTAACSFWSRVVSSGANTFWFNPTFCNLLLQLDRGTVGTDYCHGRKIMACIGTAPLDVRTKQAFEARYGFELFESFGLSETLFISTNTPRCPRVAGSVGVLLDGVTISHAEDGELLLDAPWIQRRYLQAGLESARPFRSGDLGELRSGNLFVTGRKKDLIIRGGINVSPRMIECCLSEQHPELGEVAVIGCVDALMGERTVCCLTGPLPDATLRKSANADLRLKLGKDYVVDEFVKVDSLPVNVNGKIDKRALREACAR